MTRKYLIDPAHIFYGVGFAFLMNVIYGGTLWGGMGMLYAFLRGYNVVKGEQK